MPYETRYPGQNATKEEALIALKTSEKNVVFLFERSWPWIEIVRSC